MACGFGYGGFGLGLLGGAMLASAYSPYYYGDPYYSRQPIVVVQAPSYTTTGDGGSLAPSHPHGSHSDYPGKAQRPILRSASGRDLAHRPAAPPTYEERVRLFRQGYGSDPDAVFELWQNLDSTSWFGLPGPCCPTGTPAALLIPPNGMVPPELTDIYTIEQWIDFRKRVEAVQRRDQFHPCPLFCLYFCCVSSCLDSDASTRLSTIFAEENTRLHAEGLYWDSQEGADRPEARIHTTVGHRATIQAQRICALKVDPTTRQAYEKEHPTSRRIYRMEYGALVYPHPASAASSSPPADVMLHPLPLAAAPAAATMSDPGHQHV